MKSIVIVVGLVFLNMQVQGQNLKKEEVPTPVLKAFESKYPDLKKVEWEKENGRFEAEFKAQGKEVSVVFDADGQWQQTETVLSKSELPQSVLNLLDKDYPGYKIEEACLVKTSKAETFYELEVEKGKSEFEITVMENGSLLKQEEEKDDKEGKDD